MIRDVLLPSGFLLLAMAASAETVVTPFAGVAYGGTSEGSPASYGASLAFLGPAAGFEVEFGVTPTFFGPGGSGGVFNANNVVSATGNVVLSLPAGDLRLYGVAGAGLLKTRLEDAGRLFDVSSTDFAVDVGGGLIVYLNPTVGLRADVRYFRSLSDIDPESLDLDIGAVDYWRAAGGLSLRF